MYVTTQERERRKLMDRKWNFPAVCWRKEVLRQQPPHGARSRSRAAEQYCHATTGESSGKLIYVHTHTCTLKPEIHAHKHTISLYNHSTNPLCQRYSLADMGSETAVTPIIFVLLSPSIWHLDEPIGRAEIGLKTATKTWL